MVDLKISNVSVSDIKPSKKIYSKRLFKTSATKDKSNHKTILDFMNDTESGIAMKSDDFDDQVDVTQKVLSDTPHTSMIENSSNLIGRKGSKKSRKSSNFSTEGVKKQFLNSKRENEEISMSKISFKPKIIIENGCVRIERPNFSEINKKYNEELSKGNENKTIIDMTNEKVKLTSMSFRKSTYSQKWSTEETDFFYKALSYIGTDFSLLEIVLRPRNRHQIKNKYLKEEKSNPEKIENSLKNLKPENVVKFALFLKALKSQDQDFLDNIDFKELLSKEFFKIDENITFNIDEMSSSKEDVSIEEAEKSDYEDNNIVVEKESDKTITISEESDDNWKNGPRKIYDSKLNLRKSN